MKPIKVKVQPITADAFSPYGQMLENRQPIYPEVEPGEGRVAIEMQHLKQRADIRHIGQMAIHFSYNQTFIPLRGTMVLIVAPAPRNRESGPDGYELDYDRVAAFVLEPGQAAFIEKGVWHNMYMLGTQCRHINVTRKNPGEGTTKDVDGRLEVTHSRRPYVEFVDIEKRDDCVIELELDVIRELAAV